MVHDPPAFDPAAGTERLALKASVRLLKFTAIVALPSVPAVPFWFVGDVAEASE
jgi:hypothetical protein